MNWQGELQLNEYPSASHTGLSSPGIGIPSQQHFTGPWLSQQLLLTSSLGLISLLSFSLLVKRKSWRSYLSPISRNKEWSAAERQDRQLNQGEGTRLGRLLSSVGLQWLAVTLFTSDVAVAHLSGPPTSSIDALSLLKFFRFGTRLFACMSLWSILVLMPVNWRENGWLDGVKPSDERDPQRKERTGASSGLVMQATWSSLRMLAGSRQPSHEDKKPVPIPPGSSTTPILVPTSLYDAVHLVTTFLFSGLLLHLLTTRTSALLAHHQRILHSMHSTLPARSILIRSLPPRLQSSKALRAFFDTSLEFPTVKAWVLPDVGSGLRKLLAQREKALRDLEKAWVSWIGNPVKPEFRQEWQPNAIEARIRARTQHVLAGQERLPERGWLVKSGSRSVSSETPPETLAEEGQTTTEGSLHSMREGVGNQYETMPDIHADAAYGPPSFAASRPLRRVQLFSRRKVDLLSDLEVQFVKFDAALAVIRKKMLDGEWKDIPVGFVEFQNAREALISSQVLFFEQAGFCKTTLAPDNRNIIWRNVGMPEPERRIRQVFVSIAITLLYIFYLPPLFFLGTLLSPGFFSKYIPGFYKLLSASPRLEALVSTSLPSLVLVAFNAGLPMLLESTAVWQGIKTKSDVELSVLKKYHIFLVTSVIFVFFITTTAFGVLLDLSSNPMAILDKLSLSLPQARNFSLSYVILQSLTVLPLQLLSLPILLLSSFYVMVAKTPREHAEAHPAPIFKAGYAYSQALIVATLGMLYSIVKPQVTIFAAVYFAVGYVVYKYKLLFVFYPPPSSSTGQRITIGVLRPRLIFAVFLFQSFQLSLFSLHGNVTAVFLILPLMGTTLWYARYLRKRFDRLERYEALDGALEADRTPERFTDERTTQRNQAKALVVGGHEDLQADSCSEMPREWPMTHDGSDEHGHDDDPSSEWRQAQQGTLTGTSTPSEVASLADTPKKQAALFKKIWSPVGRLKRNRSRRGTLPSVETEDLSIDESGENVRNVEASQPRMRAGLHSGDSHSSRRLIYHRPGSRFTNYREASGMSEATGFNSLPGLWEQSRFSSRSRQRCLDEREDALSENEDSSGSEYWNSPSEDGREEQSGGERANTYEHPLIHGRLRQIWLPSAFRSRSSR